MEKQIIKNRSKLSPKELILLIAFATVTITFVSTCSPLYPYNPWDDTNCFFTVGRGIIHGLVPYRDLYEQKGPLLYFIYAAAALITEKSFVGAWLIECISASIFSVFTWKTVKLFTEPSAICLALMPLLLGVVYTSGMFHFGGNSEELCFPFLTLALYFGLRAITDSDGLPKNIEALICGVITAGLFWIKYTLVGFMAGFCVYIICISIRQKNFRKLWALVWRFISGMVILSLPILIYFLANGALFYLWEGYFYNNATYYLTGSNPQGIFSIPVIRNIIYVFYFLWKTVKENPSFGILLLLSLISFVFIAKDHRKKSAFLFASTFIFTAGFVFSRPSNIFYYSYIMCYCFSLCLIPVIGGLKLLSKKIGKESSLLKMLLVISLSVLYIFSILMCKNMYLILKPKQFLAQYKIAETINQTPDAKILTYDVMDSGFYTVSGVLPCNRFFCFLNIERNYPAILEEQNRLIEEGYYDYIITTFFCENDWDNYELVQEETHPYVNFLGEQSLEGFRLYKRVQTT